MPWQDEEQACRYRLVQDGLPLLLPYVTKQVLQPTVQEFLNLIEGRSLYVPEEARATSASDATAASTAVPEAEAAAEQSTEQSNAPQHQAAGQSDGAAEIKQAGIILRPCKKQFNEPLVTKHVLAQLPCMYIFKWLHSMFQPSIFCV